MKVKCEVGRPKLKEIRNLFRLHKSALPSSEITRFAPVLSAYILLKVVSQGCVVLKVDNRTVGALFFTRNNNKKLVASFLVAAVYIVEAVVRNFASKKVLRALYAIKESAVRSVSDIQYIFVDEEFRRRGYGVYLLNYALTKINKSGFLLVTENNGLVRLLRRNFKIIFEFDGVIVAEVKSAN